MRMFRRAIIGLVIFGILGLAVGGAILVDRALDTADNERRRTNALIEELVLARQDIATLRQQLADANIEPAVDPGGTVAPDSGGSSGSTRTTRGTSPTTVATTATTQPRTCITVPLVIPSC